jgi:acyl-CoA thioesterase-1
VTRNVAPRRDRRPIALGAAAVLAVLVWALWPSPYGNVTNLRSSGSGVIAFGDSLTFGYGAAPGEDYPARLSSQIGAPVENAGVSGDTTETALARLDRDVLAKNPRIVIVGLGGNDYLQQVPIATTEVNLRSIVRRIHGGGAMVILLGFEFPSLNARYDTMYERVAEEERTLLVPGVLSGILTDSNLRSDAIHPNARGYELMAKRLSKPLRTLIAKADGARS